MSLKYEEALLAAIADFNRWYLRMPCHTEGMNSTKGVFVNSLKRKMKEFNPGVDMNILHNNIITSMINMKVNDKHGIEELFFKLDDKKWARSNQEVFVENFNKIIEKLDFTYLGINLKLDVFDISWDITHIINQVKSFNFKNL